MLYPLKFPSSVPSFLYFQNRQGWISWIFEVLQDKPYSAKLNIKTKDLKQELESLEEEESRLNEKLGIIDIPPVVGVSS